MRRSMSNPAIVKVCLALFLIGLAAEFPEVKFANKIFVKEAEAYRGGPASPRGGARRTARRTSRRVTYRRVAYGTRVYALPSGCTTVIAHGREYYYCGGDYYRPYYQGNEVVYVVVQEP